MNVKVMKYKVVVVRSVVMAVAILVAVPSGAHSENPGIEYGIANIGLNICSFKDGSDRDFMFMWKLSSTGFWYPDGKWERLRVGMFVTIPIWTSRFESQSIISFKPGFQTQFELIYSQKGGTFTSPYDDFIQEIGFYYVEVPVLLKYELFRLRLTDRVLGECHLYTGPSIGFKVWSNVYNASETVWEFAYGIDYAVQNIAPFGGKLIFDLRMSTGLTDAFTSFGSHYDIPLGVPAIGRGEDFMNMRDDHKSPDLKTSTVSLTLGYAL